MVDAIHLWSKRSESRVVVDGDPTAIGMPGHHVSSSGFELLVVGLYWLEQDMARAHPLQVGKTHYRIKLTSLIEPRASFWSSMERGSSFNGFLLSCYYNYNNIGLAQ